VTHVSPTP